LKDYWKGSQFQPYARRSEGTVGGSLSRLNLGVDATIQIEDTGYTREGSYNIFTSLVCDIRLNMMLVPQLIVVTCGYTRTVWHVPCQTSCHLTTSRRPGIPKSSLSGALNALTRLPCRKESGTAAVPYACIDTNSEIVGCFEQSLWRDVGT
jgi:hypothetical protein